MIGGIPDALFKYLINITNNFVFGDFYPIYG
jgi:hypothetical protein